MLLLCQVSLRAFLTTQRYCSLESEIYFNAAQQSSEENRPVIYLDETSVHASYPLQKCWQSVKEPGVLASDSVGARWIIAHAGSKSGFVENGLLLFKSKSKSNDYHDDMNSVNFTLWMKEKIVPCLPLTSIVVMDNASYHSTQINKTPTMGNTKAELKEWLMKNGIEVDDCWTKPQLYDIIKRYKGEPQYEVKQLLNEHRHKVLRLPPYPCDLNAIEKNWAIVKRSIAEKNVSQALKNRRYILRFRQAFRYRNG
ncbi:unnamed protein product, partial [Brenthis ino]